MINLTLDLNFYKAVIKVAKSDNFDKMSHLCMALSDISSLDSHRYTDSMLMDIVSEVFFTVVTKNRYQKIFVDLFEDGDIYKEKVIVRMLSEIRNTTIMQIDKSLGLNKKSEETLDLDLF